jgi:hypothetical protein
VFNRNCPEPPNLPHAQAGTPYPPAHRPLSGEDWVPGHLTGAPSLFNQAARARIEVEIAGERVVALGATEDQFIDTVALFLSERRGSAIKAPNRPGELNAWTLAPHGGSPFRIALVGG